MLNLGHTVGHAIEAATAFSRYSHGEAVGAGAAREPVALAAPVRPGSAARKRAAQALLDGLGLPRGSTACLPRRRLRPHAPRQEGRPRRRRLRAAGGPREPAPRRARAAGARTGGRRVADATVKTLWLLHGVNLDMLGRRDPAHYGALTLAELESLRGRLRRGARLRGALLPDQPRGRARREAPRDRARGRRRRDHQPRRLDALQLRRARRAGAGGRADRRGAPLGDRGARGVAPAVGDRRSGRGARERQGARGLRRGGRRPGRHHRARGAGSERPPGALPRRFWTTSGSTASWSARLPTCAISPASAATTPRWSSAGTPL